MEEAERERVEERLFTDENFADELEQAESRLIDDYAFNALTPQDREKFERNFIFNDERRKTCCLPERWTLIWTQTAPRRSKSGPGMSLCRRTSCGRRSKRIEY